jgi:signal transduction histidine kinase
MQPRLSIRAKLLFSILFILVVSYSILIYSNVRSVSASLEEKIGKELEQDLNYVKSHYVLRATQINYVMQQSAAAPAVHAVVRHRDSAWLQQALKRWRRILPFIEVLTVVDARQRVLARVNSTATGDVFEVGGAVAKALREKQPLISTERVPLEFLCKENVANYCAPLPNTKEAMMVTVVTPVIDEKGAVLGAIVSGDVINRDPQLPFKVQEIFGKEVAVTINQGRISIASTFSDHVTFLATVDPDIQARLDRGLSYRGEALFGDTVYKTAFEPIANSKGETVGSLAVALSMDDVKRIRHDSLANIRNSAVVAIILAFAMAWFVARKLTGPLRELARGAQRIETGDLSQQVAVAGSDEFGMLADSFNRMARALVERDRTITKKTQDLQELNELLEKKVAVRTTELRLEMGRLEAILMSMAEGVVVTDRDNRVIVCNPAALKIFELVPHRVLHQPVDQVCEAGGFCRLVDFIVELRAGGDLATVREEEMAVKGKKLKVNLAPLLDEGGMFAGVVMSLRDVTVEGEVDRMKNDFISTVSHELKTPLTSIKGALQFVLNKGKWLTDTERELLSVCLRNTDRLIRLISDILDISKIEAGRIELAFEPLSVNELVTYSIEEIKGFALSRNVSIINRIDPDLPTIYGDHDRLMQVLTNLLSNAVKFSPEGKIITATAALQGNYVAVSVIDHGRSIKWSDRDKLFKRFQRLESSGTQENGGTGLGLAICREIVELHHGKIYYEPGLAGGNIFTFTVPVFEENR